MTSPDVVSDAAYLEQLLPRLMRRLFMPVAEHPSNHISIAQLRVCLLLQDGPISLNAAADELGISSSAVCQIVDRLEQAGLVERVTEPQDRRVRLLQLTTPGAEMMASRRKGRVERASQILQSLDTEERATVIGTLHKLLNVALAEEQAAPLADLPHPVAK